MKQTKARPNSDHWDGIEKAQQNITTNDDEATKKINYTMVRTSIMSCFALGSLGCGPQLVADCLYNRISCHNSTMFVKFETLRIRLDFFFNFRCLVSQLTCYDISIHILSQKWLNETIEWNSIKWKKNTFDCSKNEWRANE